MDSLQQLQDDEYSFPYHYISQFRNRFTQNYYDSWGVNYVSTIEFILKKLEKESFNSLVDIGCGDGRLALEIKNNFSSLEILGIDYSKRAIQLAQSMNPYGNYKQLDILTQSVEKKFDVGILMEVFEHINPEMGDEFVQAISKLLKPGGLLYVTVPHINKVVEYKHYRHFSSESLIKCFESGFDVVEVVPFEKGKFRKKVLDFLLGNRLFILNSGKLRTILYRYYKENLFFCAENKCNRIFVKFKAK